jgi:hypothetical protein
LIFLFTNILRCHELGTKVVRHLIEDRYANSLLGIPDGQVKSIWPQFVTVAYISSCVAKERGRVVGYVDGDVAFGCEINFHVVKAGTAFVDGVCNCTVWQDGI